MATTAAQDEFNALMSRQTPRLVRHHSEKSNRSSGSEGSTTIAPSHRSSKKSSVRASNHSSRSKRSARAASHISTSSQQSQWYHDSSDSDGDTPGPVKSSTYYLPPTYQRGAMTGPKGVIADAEAFERERRGGSDNFERTKDLALPRSQSYGGLTPTGSRKGSDAKSEDSSDEEVRRWREKRMKELQSSSKDRSQRFGQLAAVDGIGFLEAVEKAGRGAVVIVYIFDDQSNISDAFATHLSAVATKHKTTQFVALHHEDAGIDAAGVPAILAYRNGEKFADIMPLVDEVSFTSNVVKNLEQAMIRKKMIR